MATNKNVLKALARRKKATGTSALMKMSSTSIFYRSIFAIFIAFIVYYVMSSSKTDDETSFIYNGPTAFVIATSRGLEDARSPEAFLSGCPEDFFDALKKANEKTAQDGEKFLAIRVPLHDKALDHAPYSERLKAAMKFVDDNLPLGRVERSAETMDNEPRSILLISPVILNGRKIRDNRVTLLGPEKFMEATEDGFMEFDPEDMPEGVREQYLRMEKESPGSIIVTRVTLDDHASMSGAEALQATLDATWKAAQINPPKSLADVARKEDMVKAMYAITPDGERYALDDLIGMTQHLTGERKEIEL